MPKSTESPEGLKAEVGELGDNLSRDSDKFDQIFDQIEGYFSREFSSVQEALEKKIEDNINDKNIGDELKKYLSNLIEAHKEDINQQLDDSTEDKLTDFLKDAQAGSKNAGLVDIEKYLDKALDIFKTYDPQFDDVQKKIIALIDDASAGSVNPDQETAKNMLNKHIISCRAKVFEALKSVLNPLSKSDKIIEHIDAILLKLNEAVDDIREMVVFDDNTTVDANYTLNTASINTDDNISSVPKTSFHDKSVPDSSEKLTVKHRIKELEAHAENLPRDARLEYILSELFSSGASSEVSLKTSGVEASQGRGARPSIVLSEKRTQAWYGDAASSEPKLPPPSSSSIPISIPKEGTVEGTVKKAREELLTKGFGPRSPYPDPSEKKEGDKVAQTKVLAILKKYYFALKVHEDPEQPSAVSEQLVVTIKTLDPDFDATEELRAASPRSITQGPGASESAEAQQDVTPEKHLKLLQELDKKLTELLLMHDVQLPQETRTELLKLQGIVKQSITVVQQQVIKEQSSALRPESGDGNNYKLGGP